MAVCKAVFAGLHVLWNLEFAPCCSVRICLAGLCLINGCVPPEWVREFDGVVPDERRILSLFQLPVYDSEGDGLSRLVESTVRENECVVVFSFTCGWGINFGDG